MAKSDINRLTGRMGPSIDKIRRESLERVFQEMDKELNKKKANPMQPGIRQKIIVAYEKGGIEEAYKVVEEINKRYKKEIFNKAKVDEWINEYKQTKLLKQGEAKGSDDDAR